MLTFLIAPPYSPFTPKEAAVPPLGLARIAAVAQEHGDVVVCDMGVYEASGADGWSALAAVASSEPPDIIGIGPVVTSNRRKSMRIARFMRARFPAATIVVGGPDPTFTYAQVLAEEPAVDIVFIGESERSFRALLANLYAPQIWTQIKGLALRSGDGVCASQPELLSRTEFETLPFPAWGLFPLDVYRDIAASVNAAPYLPIETSRGCPLDCVFCACSNLFSRRFRNRTPAGVLAEMQHTCDTHGISRFSLNDDNPSINSNHVMRLGRGFLERAPGRFELTFSATVDCRLFQNDADMRLLRDAGFLEVFMGCETPHAAVIEATMKTSEPALWGERIVHAVEASRRAGIASRTSWILGLPRETRKSFEDTIDFIRELRPDTALLSLLQPYPGTLIERYLSDPNNEFGLRKLADTPSAFVASKFDPVVETKDLSRSDIVDLSYRFITELSPFLEANVSGSPYYLFELWRERDSARRITESA